MKKSEAIKHLAAAAQSYCDDLSTGLDDGTYEQGQQDLDDTDKALQIVDEIVSFFIRQEEPIKRVNPHCVCSKCDSDDILKDAYADQNSETGQWELHSTYDHFVCETCGGETSIKEVEQI